MYLDPDPIALEKEAREDEIYCMPEMKEGKRCFDRFCKVSEHYILSGKLFNKRALLKRHGVRLYGDYGHQYEDCQELATEMLNCPDHKAWSLFN